MTNFAISDICVPVDHFGVAAAACIRNLLNMSSNKRARNQARSDLERFAKAAGTIPRNASETVIGLVVRPGGVQLLSFSYLEPIKLSDTLHANELFPQTPFSPVSINTNAEEPIVLTQD